MTLDNLLWNEAFEKDEDSKPEAYYDYKEELAMEHYYENKYKDQDSNI